ncbi:hypothetical protein SAMN00790413_03673 [Deinococcus hopiensis KR-140]|uniref:Uncharacterized protein n=1 Tax=Deinococcus hopiensis KR-140 TaxID=695939 RepID=A0A1W1UYK9_9DEIO|nr:hypothetical protein SAMN00790413_03673 [Deinococcus hopiensis KR-140]
MPVEAEAVLSDWSEPRAGVTQHLPFQRVVVSAVLELLTDAPAHQQPPLVWINGEVPPVIQLVQVAAQQETVVHRVRFALRVGLHVRGFQDGERLLPRNAAAPSVHFRDQSTESGLPQPRLHDSGSSKACARHDLFRRRTPLLQRLLLKTS